MSFNDRKLGFGSELSFNSNEKHLRNVCIISFTQNSN